MQTIILGIVATLMFSGPLWAESVSLPDYLEMVMDKHPMVTAERERIESAAAKARQTRGLSDWIASASPFLSQQRPLLTGFSYESLNSYGGDIGISRRLLDMGGMVSLGLKSQHIDARFPSNLTSANRKGFQNILSVSYQQSLLQNWGGIVDRLPIVVAETGVEKQRLNFAENKEKLQLSLSMLYLKWVHLHVQSDIAIERLQLSARQLRELEKQRRSNLVNLADVLRAADAKRQAEQGLTLLESQVDAAAIELRTFAEYANQKDVGVVQAKESWLPEFDLYQLYPLQAISVSLNRWISSSRQFRSFALDRQLLGYQEDVQRSKVDPQLNLNVSGVLQSQDEAFGRSFKFDRNDVAVSLALQTPLGNDDAIGALDAHKAEAAVFEDMVALERLNRLARAKGYLTQLRGLTEVLGLNEEQIASAKRITREEDRLYRQGRTQLVFVIQARDNEQQAKLTYANNALRYQQLYLELLELLDRLDLDA